MQIYAVETFIQTQEKQSETKKRRLFFFGGGGGGNLQYRSTKIRPSMRKIEIKDLGGGFKDFLCSPLPGGRFHFD